MSVIICGGRTCRCCHRDFETEEMLVSLCYECQDLTNFECGQCCAEGIGIAKDTWPPGKLHKTKDTRQTVCGMRYDIGWWEMTWGNESTDRCQRCWPKEKP